MEKLETLKKMIAEISNNPRYIGKVFQTDTDFFAICGNQLYISENEYEYYVMNYTEEEYNYVMKVEKELNLDWDLLLPYKGSVVCDLSDLYDYYEDKEDKQRQVEKLLELLGDEKSIFFDREREFLQILMLKEFESGEVCVHTYWDHDDAYYMGLDYRTGVFDSLFDIIVDDACRIYLDDFDDEECEMWIEILSDLDQYMVT